MRIVCRGIEKQSCGRLDKMVLYIKPGGNPGKECYMKECCREYLAKQIGDSEEDIAAIYSEYVKSVGVKADEAQAALAAGAWHELDKVAHTVKGNSLSVGDQQMADVAIALRGAAQLQDRGKAEQLIAEMRALSEQF